MSWFRNIKVGDVVEIKASVFGKRTYKKRVARLTKTMIILEGGQRYRRSDGLIVGYQYLGESSEIVDFQSGGLA